jgi:hypothetical protein
MATTDREPTGLEGLFSGVGFRGFRLGPGTVGNIATVAAVTVGSCAIVGWALSHEPLLAFGAVVVILAYGVYFAERGFRFAEKHPAEALMGGSEYFQYLRDQTAKDSSIVINAPAVNAGPAQPQIQKLQDLD